VLSEPLRFNCVIASQKQTKGVTAAATAEFGRAEPLGNARFDVGHGQGANIDWVARVCAPIDDWHIERCYDLIDGLGLAKLQTIGWVHGRTLHRHS
jgi:hypothetical protein